MLMKTTFLNAKTKRRLTAGVNLRSSGTSGLFPRCSCVHRCVNFSDNRYTKAANFGVQAPEFEG
jgi:hypothetical protein